jgi:hypothetical protein
MFRRDPYQRALFSTDMEVQEVRLAQKFTEIVQPLPRLDALRRDTRQLGARHVGYGVRVAD